MNNKIEDFLGGIKIGEMLHKNEVETEKNKNFILKSCLITLSVIIVVVAIALIAYKVVSDKFDDFDDFDDDFDDDFLFDDDYDIDDDNGFIISDSTEE